MDIECYKCHRGTEGKRMMARVHAPGLWWICSECIEKEEKKTGTTAVLFYNSGIRFLTKEQIDSLPKNEPKNDEENDD